VYIQAIGHLEIATHQMSVMIGNCINATMVASWEIYNKQFEKKRCGYSTSLTVMYNTSELSHYT
jgi:hypothetical protein